MRAGRLYVAGLAVAVYLSLPQAAPGQSYAFTKVVDYLTPRPDGAGVFTINAVTTPSFDGQWVVFRDNGPVDDVTLASIWSFNTLDGTLHKLVSLTTPVPGGTGAFSSVQLLDTAPFVRQGRVIFVARDSNAFPHNQGLYAMPAAGGPIVKIADYQTANPSGGLFTVFDAAGHQAGGFSFDGTTVVFNAQGSAGTVGDYSAPPDGSSLGMVADSLHPYHAAAVNNPANFISPAISGSNIVLAGVSGSDPGTSYNGIYLGSVGGNGTLTELLNTNQRLPDDPSVSFHTRFDAPVLAVDGALIAFRATNSNAAFFFGLYTTDLASHTISKVVDVNSTLPGLGRLTAIADGGVAVSRGSVFFRAGDNTGRSGLYVWNNGTLARIIGSGDHFDGQNVVSVGDPGPAALDRSGFAFNVDFAGGRALYAATANTVTLSAVDNAASHATSSIAPGEIVTLLGAGMGPAALAAFQLDANNRLTTQLAGTRVLFNGVAAPLIYTSDLQSAAIVPFGIAVGPTAQVVVEYNNHASAPVTVPVTNTMPGLFSANSTGSEEGTIQHLDGSLNSAANPAPVGSIIILYATGLGQLNPAPVDGSFVPAAAPPALQFPVTVTIGGHPAQIVSQGPAPLQIAGLYQIQCVIPPGTPPGPAAVVVTADGKQSQPNLTVAVQ